MSHEAGSTPRQFRGCILPDGNQIAAELQHGTTKTAEGQWFITETTCSEHTIKNNPRHCY